MVVLKEVTSMFWGVTIDGGKRYSQTVERSFHISMAALEPSSAKGCVSLMIQHEKAEFLLCTLDTKNIYQQPLDLNLTEGEEVTFFLTGSGIIHLTGYLMEDEEEQLDYPQSMDSSDYDSSDEEAPELVTPPSSAKIKATDIKRKLASAYDAVPVKKKKSQLLVDDTDEDSSDDSEDPSYMGDEALENSDEDSEEDDDDDEGDEIVPPGWEEDDDDDDDDDDEEDNEEKKERKTPASAKQKSNKVTNQDKQKQTPKNVSKVSTPKSAPSASKSPTSKTPVTDNKPETGDTTEGKKKKKKKKKKAEEGQSANGPEESGGKTKGQEKTTPQKKVVAGGTVVEEVRVGHGPEAKPGKMVHVYYSGKLTSGKQFDSCTSGKPFRFKLGKQEVIKGWDSGVTGMKVGGKRRLTVPANQGYGNQRQGPIPPNSTLVFDVELKAVS